MIRICRSCGKKNRVPASRLAERGTCGACKSALPPAATPIDVGPADFRDVIDNARVPVLVDFWAQWCGPCRMAAPVVARVARQQAGRALVLKVNTEAHPDLAARYGIRGIPNFIVFQDGQVVMQQAGLVDERTMAGWLSGTAAA